MISCKNFLITIKWKWQKITRGFSDPESWELDTTIAKFVLPRLEEYRNTNQILPVQFMQEQWNTTLDKMIYSMKIMAMDNYLEYILDHPEEMCKIQEGFTLFGKHLFDLWW